MAIDIIITTRNRLGYFKRTLAFLHMRTRSPYRLHVIDDASDEEGKVDYLLDQFSKGHIHDLLLRKPHYGPMANLNVGAWMSFSDPVVFCDDDVLCPDVEPDWLARGVAQMNKHPKVAMLALNHPGAKKKGYKQMGEITYCKSLGGTFLFVRRKFLLANPLPHGIGNLAGPQEFRCLRARNNNWKLAYLTHTYCFHIGKYSELTGKDYKGKFIDPTDWKTLQPAARWMK